MLWWLSVASAATLVAGTDAPSLQATIDRAVDGDTVLVPEGVWHGPITVNRSITLRGTGGVLDGEHEGTILRVSAPNVVVEQLHLVNSGHDLRAEDACIRTAPSAAGTILRDNTLTSCDFGIWVHQGKGVHLLNNHIEGLRDITGSRKGNGIHLFDGSELEIRGNVVQYARDGIYVSATHNSVIADNKASYQRYGIHYMYSFDNVIQGNQTNHNTGGIALMQSHRLRVEDNISSFKKEKGVLFRDVQYTQIRGNTVEGNGEGFFFFSSYDNTIEANTFLNNGTGARIWAGTGRNLVVDNAFVGNREQVLYISHEDQVWGAPGRGNYWSDYVGWDQDGDGLGDRPYRVDSLTANLLHRYPSAVLLLSSPALELLRYLQERTPSLRFDTIIDPQPRVSP